MRRKWSWIAVLSAAMLFTAACQGGGTNTQSTDPGTGETTAAESGEEESNSGFYFADFEAEDLDGNAVDESIFENAEVTMINIWGTFCGPCINEMPYLGELSGEWSGKVQIIGVCSDIADSSGNAAEAGISEAKDIVEQTGASYVHLAPNPEMMQGYLQYVMAVPTTLFVDQDGNQIGKIVMGAKDKEGWEAEFEARLESVKGA